jgi:endonuclease-3
MKSKQEIKHILQILREYIPEPKTELVYHTPFQLMVAVILSAQCTDERVNKVTPSLFEKYPDAESLSKASYEELFSLIKSISYPNNKTKHLLEASKILVEKYQGRVPETLEELTQIPGVGRKTANVLLSVLYQKPAMAVDTHVQRVVNRLGWVKTQNPLQTEKKLLQLIEPQDIPDAHHLLILHGRYTCKAKKPNCTSCPIRDFCDFYQYNR